MRIKVISEEERQFWNNTYHVWADDNYIYRQCGDAKSAYRYKKYNESMTCQIKDKAITISKNILELWDKNFSQVYTPFDIYYAVSALSLLDKEITVLNVDNFLK